MKKPIYQGGTTKLLVEVKVELSGVVEIHELRQAKGLTG